MALTRIEVERLAELARLELSDADKEKAQGQLDRVLGYVSRLSKVDTTGVPEAEAGQASVTRPDVALPCDEMVRTLIVQNFPDHVGDLLRVPAVFEKPKGKEQS